MRDISSWIFLHRISRIRWAGYPVPRRYVKALNWGAPFHSMLSRYSGILLCLPMPQISLHESCIDIGHFRLPDKILRYLTYFWNSGWSVLRQSHSSELQTGVSMMWVRYPPPSSCICFCEPILLCLYICHLPVKRAQLADSLWWLHYQRLILNPQTRHGIQTGNSHSKLSWRCCFGWCENVSDYDLFFTSLMFSDSEDTDDKSFNMLSLFLVGDSKNLVREVMSDPTILSFSELVYLCIPIHRHISSSPSPTSLCPCKDK